MYGGGKWGGRVKDIGPKKNMSDLAREGPRLIHYYVCYCQSLMGPGVDNPSVKNSINKPSDSRSDEGENRHPCRSRLPVSNPFLIRCDVWVGCPPFLPLRFLPVPTALPLLTGGTPHPFLLPPFPFLSTVSLCSVVDKGVNMTFRLQNTVFLLRKLKDFETGVSLLRNDNSSFQS